MTAAETRERFLREIGGRLSADRVEELHLFPPLRQGGIESAVAVIAARPVLADDPPGPDRLTVFRAHYRLVLKGPERGTWEMGLIEEADAPPPTVGAVVRGVHERAGGDDEPERLSGDAFRIAISDRPWEAAG